MPVPWWEELWWGLCRAGVIGMLSGKCREGMWSPLEVCFSLQLRMLQVCFSFHLMASVNTLSITNYWSLHSALSQGWAQHLWENPPQSLHNPSQPWACKERNTFCVAHLKIHQCVPHQGGEDGAFLGEHLFQIVDWCYLPCQRGSVISLPRLCISAPRLRTVEK